MTASLLLDTHIALWLDSGDDRLRPPTRALIDDRWRAGGSIQLSAVSAWEIALLAESGRVTLDVPVEDWLRRFVDRPGLSILPLDWHIACLAYRLYPLEHRDPADRMLIATAITHGCSLVTYDARILHFAERHGTQFRLAVEA